MANIEPPRGCQPAGKIPDNLTVRSSAASSTPQPVSSPPTCTRSSSRRSAGFIVFWFVCSFCFVLFSVNDTWLDATKLLSHVTRTLPSLSHFMERDRPLCSQVGLTKSLNLESKRFGFYTRIGPSICAIVSWLPYLAEP